ncbi:hypothetical protein [Bdellovibrio sp. HCB2-146]|uniref:hypothetical protein n=1 Tax=Bdellovibrio sp. HCB2-146 TaxID=3394362 RepID=UPI0039BC5014
MATKSTNTKKTRSTKKDKTKKAGARRASPRNAGDLPPYHEEDYDFESPYRHSGRAQQSYPRQPYRI